MIHAHTQHTAFGTTNNCHEKEKKARKQIVAQQGNLLKPQKGCIFVGLDRIPSDTERSDTYNDSLRTNRGYMLNLAIRSGSLSNRGYVALRLPSGSVSVSPAREVGI